MGGLHRIFHGIYVLSNFHVTFIRKRYIDYSVIPTIRSHEVLHFATFLIGAYFTYWLTQKFSYGTN